MGTISVRSYKNKSYRVCDCWKKWIFWAPTAWDMIYQSVRTIESIICIADEGVHI